MTSKRVLPVDSGPDKNATLEELFDHLKSHASLDERIFPRSDVIEVFIKTDRPLPISFAGDMHIGSTGTDYAQIQSDLAFLEAHPELKLMLLGDICDNYTTSFKSAQPVLDQACSPKMQRQILLRIVERLAKNKSLICSVWGNHEGRDENIIGDNPFANILSKAGPYFDGAGIVMLYVGKTKETATLYTIVLAHKPPSRSQLDKNIGAKKLYLSRYPGSVIVTAHYHDPSITQDSAYNTARDMGMNFGGKRVLISLGTYQLEDIFSKRHWAGGRMGTPTVLLWPDAYKMEVFSSATDALIYREGMRHWKVSK